MIPPCNSAQIRSDTSQHHLLNCSCICILASIIAASYVEASGAVFMSTVVRYTVHTDYEHGLERRESKQHSSHNPLKEFLKPSKPKMAGILHLRPFLH